MSKKVLYLLGILATIFLGTWLYIAYCCCNCSIKETPKSISNTTTSQNNKSMRKVVKSNFNFKNSDFNSILPISDSINDVITKLKSELDNSPNSQITITGFYNSNEKNNSIFQNLGMARANNVKNYLTTHGIPEEKMELFSTLDENISIQNDTVFGPITFRALQLKENLSDKTDWATLKANANAKPLTLYFKKNEASITLSEADRSKINDLLSYLANVPNSKIIITGHTDNSGLKENNAYYSIERAKFAKKYFVENGISENKIITYGKGSSKPIADNETEIGRSKNRRAELTLQ
jgi:OmpA-OmpF porin, OOP family